MATNIGILATLSLPYEQAVQKTTDAAEPGQGTTFKIYLPQVDEPVEELREEVVREISRGHETILIVEDEDVVRKLAVRVLKKQGYKVLEAPDRGKAFMLYEAYNDPRKARMGLYELPEVQAC